MGRAWYTHGKLLEKRNTFTDFVACARHLVSAGWTSASRLVARGGSAGGAVLGAGGYPAPPGFAGVNAPRAVLGALGPMPCPAAARSPPAWAGGGGPPAR